MILTLTELADYLRVNKRTILRMLDSKQIKGVKIGGQWRFNGSQIDRVFFPENQEKHTSELKELGHSIGVPINRIINKNMMVLDMKATTVEEAINELGNLNFFNEILLDYKDFKQRLLSRETLLSTGVGNGIALPHPRDPITTMRIPAVIIVGRSKVGIDYNAIDGKPVHLFFLICCKNIATHLHVMGKIARLLQDEEFRHSYINCNTPIKMIKAILKAENKIMLG